MINKEVGNTKESGIASVVIPTYNRANFITKTLNSVWAQTYRPIEILVIDDGSEDNTESIVKNWINTHEAEDFHIKYIYQENSGAPAARNNGIKNSTGNFLQFIDSDDLIEKEKLELQIKLMQKEHTPICLADTKEISTKGEVVKIVKKDYSINKFIRGYISTQTGAPLLNLSLIPKKVLEWTVNLPKNQDIDFFLKTLTILDSKSYINSPLNIMVHHDGERISEKLEDGKQVRYPRHLYVLIFKSIFGYNRRNFRLISYKRYLAILILYSKLLYKASFIKTIIRYIRTGGNEWRV